MKTVFVFLFFIISIESLDSEVKLISLAISQMAQKVYAGNFDFIVRGKATEKLMDIVGRVRKNVMTASKVIKIESHSQLKVEHSAILLYDSPISYKGVSLNPQKSEKLHFIVYINGLQINDILHWKIGQQLTNSLNFLYFLENRKDFVILWTFKEFEQPNCRESKKIFINKFSKIDKKWESGKFKVEKFSNYNGCQLVVRAQGNRGSSSKAVIENKKLVKMTGYGPKIIETISKSLNFTIKYDVFPKEKSLGNKKLTPDFSTAITSLRQRSQTKNGGVVTFPFTQVDLIFLVSRFAPYTSFQKNFLPFEVEVWHWLIATLLFIATIIGIINFSPKNVQKFVFGSEVRTPMMNMM